MVNNQILYELEIDLKEAYRKHYNDEKPFISWTDALCNDFAKHISEFIKPKFSEEALFRQDNKVSETTIQRIFNGQFILKDEMHWTTRRVLNNISIYLGYDNWNVYAEIKTKKIVYLEDGKITKGDDLSDAAQSRFTFCLEVVQSAKQAEFDYYKNLPEENTDRLDDHYLTFSDESLRIIYYGKELIAKGYTLDRQSRFSILSAVYHELNKDGYRCIITSEYWYLEFSSKLPGINKHYFSLRTYQYILLTDEWKIIDIKYYPLCSRDIDYAKRVYGVRGGIYEDEMFQALPEVEY